MGVPMGRPRQNGVSAAVPLVMSALLNLLLRRERFAVDSALDVERAAAKLRGWIGAGGDSGLVVRGVVRGLQMRVRGAGAVAAGDLFWEPRRTPTLYAELRATGAGCRLEGVWWLGPSSAVLLLFLPFYALWLLISVGFWIDFGAVAGLAMLASGFAPLAFGLVGAELVSARGLARKAGVEAALAERLEAG